MPTNIKVTERDVENMQCGIPLCLSTPSAIIVPEGHSVRTPRWATEKIIISDREMTAVLNGETILLAGWLHLGRIKDDEK